MCIRDSVSIKEGVDGNDWQDMRVTMTKAAGVSLIGCSTGAVSYTHLDVYKRQGKKTGKMLRVALDNERDVYELCANMASRRIRACILQ